MPDATADLFGLPSVQVRAVSDSYESVAPGQQAIVINRVPERDEVEVPHRTLGAPTPIQLQVLSLTGAPQRWVTRIRVDGQTIVSNSEVVAPGWDGHFELLGDAVLSASIWRTTAFPSAHRTEVEVAHNDVVIGTYAFTWRDETPPELTDVAADDADVVRARFNEVVATNTALDPARYRLRGVSRFAATSPKVIGVQAGSAAGEVVLAFDQPLSFGQTYELRAEGVVDRYGNVIAEEAGRVTFVAYSPPVPAGRRFQLWDFIPELHKRSDAHTGELHSFISVLQEPTNVLLYEIDRFAHLADPDLAPEPYVERMLADFGCPFDISELTSGEKRKLLRELVGIYQHKGTTEGLIRAARTLYGITLEVEALNEGGWQLGVMQLGEPETALGPETSYQRFSFEVTAVREQHEAALSEAARARLIELIHIMRPAHTHFRRLNERVIIPA